MLAIQGRGSLDALPSVISELTCSVKLLCRLRRLGAVSTLTARSSSGRD